MIKKLIFSAFKPPPAAALFLRNTHDLLYQCNPQRSTTQGFTLAGYDVMAVGTYEPDDAPLVHKLLVEVDTVLVRWMDIRVTY